MDAEELEIARRLVACEGWVWLPGMAKRDADFPHLAWRSRVLADTLVVWGALPDLDDDLTRLGVLAVVRRAWGDPLMFVTYDSDSMSYAEVQPFGVWLPSIPGPLPIAVGPTEETALLAALEAAPHG